MRSGYQNKVQAGPAQNFTPIQTGLLHRQCALCNTPGLVEDSERDTEKLTLQRSSADQAGTTTVPPIVPRDGHDFGRVSVHSTWPGMIQTKLKINKPGDLYEQEADRVAEQVMGMGKVQRQPDDEVVQTKPMITPLIQRLTEEEEEEEILQPKELPGQSPEVTPALSSRIQSLKGGGQALPESTRSYFEPRFGYDFSQVKVHVDTQAAEATQAVNARAFTVGNRVVFGEGQYMPGTKQGKGLLAHELAHVVQQSNGNIMINRQITSQCEQKNKTMDAQIPYGDKENTKKWVEAYVKKNLKHLDSLKQQLIWVVASYYKKIPLSRIICNVEMNAPILINEERRGNRIRAKVIDPQLLPSERLSPMKESDFLIFLSKMRRTITFVQGVNEATADPVSLPNIGMCNNAEMKQNENSCCTQDMMAEFKEHLGKARKYTIRAIDHLKGDELIFCNLKNNFGKQGTEANVRIITMRLNSALMELFLSRHSWKCRPRGSGHLGCVKKEKGTVGGRASSISTDITICVDEKSPFTDWVIILHEIMHRVGVSGKEIYKNESGYPGDNALYNADSYAQFVAEIGSRDWNPCKQFIFGLQGELGLTSTLNPVLAARIELTKEGPALRVLDYKFGVSILWMPHFGTIGGDPEILTRGFIGLDFGARLTLPPHRQSALVVDIAAGGGAYFPGGTFKPKFKPTISGSARWRLEGFEVGAGMQKIFNLAEKDEWVFLISIGSRQSKLLKRQR